MINTLCETMADLAAKVVAITSWGDFGGLPENERLWGELRALIVNAGAAG